MKFYSVTQCAKILGLSRQWVSAHIARGNIKGQRVSGSAFIIAQPEIERLKLNGRLPRKKYTKHVS